MARTSSNVPKYRRQKAKPYDRAFVEIEGQRHYLGRHGTGESRERYARLLAEWSSGGRRAPIPNRGDPAATIEELIAAYWTRHVLGYYRKPDGTPTDTITAIQSALRRLHGLYGSAMAADFGPLDLQNVRQTMIDENYRRSTINKHTNLIRQFFGWCVSQELVAVEVWQALKSVPGLRAGRSKAKPSRIVKPVPEPYVDAIRPYVSRQVNAVIDLQLLTGARSSELLHLRPMALDTSGEVWTAELAEHKTAYRGRTRTICFGRQAQAVLRSFLNRAIDAYLFDPREAEAERRAAAATHRRPGQKPTPRKTDRKLSDHFAARAYGQAIRRACVLACVPHWHPHQLRHNHATRIRKRFGLEAAQVMLGHAHANVTEIYAESSRDKAVEIAAMVG